MTVTLFWTQSFNHIYDNKSNYVNNIYFYKSHRLGTGWSSRAQSAQRRRAQPLTTDEEEQILRVLRRNELLAENEKARVE